MCRVGGGSGPQPLSYGSLDFSIFKFLKLSNEYNHNMVTLLGKYHTEAQDDNCPSNAALQFNRAYGNFNAIQAHGDAISEDYCSSYAVLVTY